MICKESVVTPALAVGEEERATFSVPARVRSTSVLKVAAPLAVKVPVKVVLPVTARALLTVVVPVAAPILNVVAAPAKLTVVAMVLTRAKVVESVTKLVVMVGEVAKTANPVPVSLDNVSAKLADVPVVAKLEEASVVTNLEAVRPERVIVPDDDIPVRPEAAPAAVISQTEESMATLSPPSPMLATPLRVVVPLTVAVLKVMLPDVKAIVGSVAPASKVQVMPEPEPKVVVPISVVSRLRVTVSVAVPTVSIPFVPPATSRVFASDMV